MTVLFSHLRQSLRKPDHWLYGSWLDMVVKYRKTYLGVLWVLIPTAVYIWGVGGFIAALQPGIGRAEFLAHTALGFVLFRLITTAILDATSAFHSYQVFIYDGQGQLTDFILRNLSRSCFYFLLTLPLVVAALSASDGLSLPGMGWALLGLAVVMVNLLAYSVLFAFLGARFADLAELMGSAVLAGFLITPVVWYPQMAPVGTLHGSLMRANPLYHLIEGVRAPLLGQALEPSTLAYLAAMSVIGIAAATACYARFFRRVPTWL